MLQTAHCPLLTFYFSIRSNNLQCYKLRLRLRLFTFYFEAIIINVTNCPLPTAYCLHFQFEAKISNVTNCDCDCDCPLPLPTATTSYQLPNFPYLSQNFRNEKDLTFDNNFIFIRIGNCTERNDKRR